VDERDWKHNDNTIRYSTGSRRTLYRGRSASICKPSLLICLAVRYRGTDGCPTVHPGGWTSLDDELVIDVPQEWAATATYCASLGHKANHRTPVNAAYAPLYHPRFGDVKCVRCLCDVAAGEELTVDYGYLGDHGYPEWWSA